MPETNKELDALLNTPPDDEEDENKNENENKNEEENKEENNKEENENEEGEENEENEENEEGGEGEDEEGEVSKEKEKDRWHGKSREEVIKEFEEQEKKTKDLETKAKEKEEGEGEEDKDKEGEEKLEIPSNKELAKMTPQDFAKWMLEQIDKRVGKTYEEKTSARDAATKEIAEARKDHPLLKDSSEYRELVLALIDTAAQKGQAIPLKEACKKVDAFIGKQKGEKGTTEEEKARLKKAKAQVESGKGAPPTPEEEKTAEQKRVEGIFGAGKSESPLGGLGV